MKAYIYTAIAVSTLALFTMCSKSKDTADGQTMSVSVASPTVDSVTITKTYPGVLSAGREVQLVARVNGYIRAKEYESGAFVRKGTVLFRIEDESYRDAVQQAQANLATARANREYASRRYDAMVEALKGDAVSEMEVAQAKSTLAECDAAIKTAMAALQTAQTQLSYCTVVAPADGHVSTDLHSVGSYVAGAGSPVVLATIYEDSHMTATFSVDDSNALGQIKESMADGTIKYNAIPLKFSEALAHSYTGDLSYMAPSVDVGTGTVALQARVENPYNELQSGMYLTIDLPVDTEPHAILIKDASISTDQLGKYVYTVNDSNKIVYTPIEVGQLVRDSLRIVTKGLTPDDRYVTKALLKVRDGMTVNPIE